MYYKSYSNPIINNYHYTTDGNRMSNPIEGEKHLVSHACVPLNELPDEQKGVTVKVAGKTLFEGRDNEVELKSDNFYVDYINGFIYLNEQLNGKELEVSYSGLGVTFFPASRVWLNVNNQNKVTKTLADIEDNIKEYSKLASEQSTWQKISSSLVDELDKKTTQGEQIRDELQVSVDNAKGAMNEISKSPIAQNLKDAREINTQLTDNITKADSANNKAEGAIKKIEGMKSDIDNQTNTLKENINLAKTSNSELSNTITSAKSSKSALDSSISKAKTERESLDNSTNKASNSKSALDESNLKADKTLSNLEAQNTKAQENIGNLKTENTRAEKNIQDLKDNSDIAETKNTDLKESIASANIIKPKLDDSVAQAKDSKSKLDSANEQAIQNRDNLDNSRATASEINDKLQKSSTTGKQVHDELTGATTKAQETKSQLDNSNQTATATDTELIENLNEARESIKKLDEVIASADLSKYITEPKLNNKLESYVLASDITIASTEEVVALV